MKFLTTQIFSPLRRTEPAEAGECPSAVGQGVTTKHQIKNKKPTSATNNFHSLRSVRAVALHNKI